MDAGWVQVVASVGGLAVAIAVLFYTARKDARDARAEIQESIERSIGPRLDGLRSNVERLEAKQDRLESKLDKMADEVGRLGREVATMHGWQQERDRKPETVGMGTPSPPHSSGRPN